MPPPNTRWVISEEKVSRSIRVVVADEFELVRHGIRLILEQVPTIRVVGEAKGADEAIELTAQLQPEVLVADFANPATIRRCKVRNSNVKLLVLSTLADHAYVASAIQAGADGYVLKQSTSGNLIQAIMSLSERDRRQPALDPRLTLKPTHTNDGPADLLSSREREVLKLVAAGHTSKGIARQLQLSSRTIGNHRARIIAKLRVDNCVQAAAQALQLGLISLSDTPIVAGENGGAGWSFKGAA
jgi:DNA-binding NarL/FixJ family response regulator